jgi:predicted transposase YbfD/YdcC
VDKARARQEMRKTEVFKLGEALENTAWAPYIKTVVRVTRHTWMRQAATGLWKERGEVCYYVTSAQGLGAAALGHIIRNHWGIENRNHHVRDVTWGEDSSRIRSNPGILTRARSFALNILRHNGVENVALALWIGALSLDTVIAYKAI